VGLRRPRTIPGTGRPSPYPRPIAGCLITIAALAIPRLSLGAVWAFTDRISDAFGPVLIPFIGLLFFPFATIAFASVRNPVGAVEAHVLVITAVVGLVDAALLGVGLFGAVRERLE
jgi:hypothetical protein